MIRTLSLFGCILIAATTLAQNQLYSYSDGQKWGLTNENLEVLAKPQFDEEFQFNGDLTYAFVKINKKWGTINRQGKIVIPCKYDRLSSHESTYIIARTGNTYALVNRLTGKEVVPVLEFDEIYRDCNCPGRYIAVKVKGKIRLLSLYDGAFINTSTYDEVKFFPAYKFNNIQYARIKTGDQYGVLNLATGKFFIPANYEKIEIFTKMGIAHFAVVQKGSKKILNRDGKPVAISPDEFSDFEDEGIVAPLVADNQHPIYPGNGLFVQNLGNDNWTITKKKDSQILETHELSGYSGIELLRPSRNLPKLFEIFKAVKNGKTGIIEKDGKVLVPFEYDTIQLQFDWLITTLNGKKGVLQRDLSLLKKPVLKNIFDCDFTQTFCVEMPGGEKGRMDKKTGKIYIPGVKE